MPVMPSSQDKQKEIAFFDAHAAESTYDVFSPESSARLIDTCVRLLELPRGSRIVDLGCGSGVFTNLVYRAGFRCVGVDISPKLVALARQNYPEMDFVEADVEHMPFPDQSFDGVLLSGLIHHFPDPSGCAAEVSRILRAGGRFVAFDPNRRNPFMWLYRDHASPLYSSIGVTENERPIIAEEVASVFERAGFVVGTDYLSKLRYRYVASQRARWLLPIYNGLDATLFSLPFLHRFSAFVLTFGAKP
jgi:ubiquinone/menaquinone biosynthesis C-methylase UbiE